MYRPQFAARTATGMMQVKAPESGEPGEPCGWCGCAEPCWSAWAGWRDGCCGCRVRAGPTRLSAAAAGARHGLDRGARPRRRAAAGISHAGRALAAGRRPRCGRPAIRPTCWSPMRTSASATMTASIRWRMLRAAGQVRQPWPHRLRRLDPVDAARPADRAARRPLARRQAQAGRPRRADRAAAEQARDPRALPDAWRPMAAISKACAPPRSPISARSRGG